MLWVISVESGSNVRRVWMMMVDENMGQRSVQQQLGLGTNLVSIPSQSHIDQVKQMP